jgi:eukaryotic-like serine/threonine-protein kinase
MTAPTEERDSASGALPVGSRIAGRYSVKEVLGDGASGIVYLAECDAAAEPGDSVAVQKGQRVAVKVIHRHLARDHQVSRRFNREARILRKLRGPNLVSLLDFGETEDGLLYMALEHVAGTPLDVLVQRESLELTRAVDLVRQICRALEAAHDAGVIHRDLKPGNVVVQRLEDGGELARVLDFGLAKMLRGDPSQSLTALTQQNMVFGTPEYMAPEQARGEEVDPRCDVYAAGVILYELLTGAVPFSGRSPIQVMTAHLTESAPPPSDRNPAAEIPPALDAAVLHALAKRPADRYPTSAAFATALQTALKRPGDVASMAPPPSDEELGMRDTELSLDAPPLTPSAPSGEPDVGNARLWLLVALVAALIGIAAGVVLSFGGRG